MSTEQNPYLGTEFIHRDRDSQTSGRKRNKSGSGTSTGLISVQEREYRQARNHKPATEGGCRVVENIQLGLVIGQIHSREVLGFSPNVMSRYDLKTKLIEE